jgi:hypothetical protein
MVGRPGRARPRRPLDDEGLNHDARDRAEHGRFVVILAHIAGIPVEELLTPFIIFAGAVFTGMRATSRRRLRRDDDNREH